MTEEQQIIDIGKKMVLSSATTNSTQNRFLYLHL
jgi:hypothetical protein